MDLYEYQARQLLEEQDIPTPDAIFAQNSHEVAEAADKIGYPCVIKAQVKIGHRGQAGGVKIAHNRDEAILESESILPMTIHGHKVSGVLVAEAKNILHEYYVSISVDRTSRDFDVLATANGGTEVEEIAKEHPEAVKRLRPGRCHRNGTEHRLLPRGRRSGRTDSAQDVALLQRQRRHARGNQSARQDRRPG